MIDIADFAMRVARSQEVVVNHNQIMDKVFARLQVRVPAANIQMHSDGGRLQATLLKPGPISAGATVSALWHLLQTAEGLTVFEDQLVTAYLAVIS